ncbi:hypothetical protein BDQ12DRAFT_691316 [Crucibulum laeve]|uniref:GATA-type domain-containing protein n=1 Tax=Crucibulum laeve TaxID=68775 RepID=A0A5C3LKK6_9AGAR|nr:hypothetical protein BDQ12DRAFT_691316 [Crucibulum laeve]
MQREQSTQSSNRRSVGGYESSYSSSTLSSPSPMHRGSWPTTQYYSGGVDSSNDHQYSYSRRFSLPAQERSWNRLPYSAMREVTESYGAVDGRSILHSSAPSPHSSPSWTNAQNFTPPPATPALPEFHHPLSSQYGAPQGLSTMTEEPYGWDEGNLATFPPTGVEVHPNTHTSQTSYPSNSLNVDIPPFNTRSWDDMLLTALDSSSSYTPQHGVALNGYTFPHCMPVSPSPSPSPVYPPSLPRNSPCSSGKSTPPEPHKTTVDRTGAVKKCSHCQATSTPLWRREPTTLKPLCNACGLYLQQRNKLRPQELIDADADDQDSDDSDQNYVGPECTHCRTHHTSVWRRSKTGEQLCNACGVYARLRGKPRPLSLKRNKIKPRSKHPPVAK